MEIKSIIKKIGYACIAFVAYVFMYNTFYNAVYTAVQSIHDYIDNKSMKD